MLNTIQFKPLYWVYHDCWDYQSQTWAQGRYGPETSTRTFHHYGHMHFFIPGFYTGQANSQQAYSGQQVYNFNYSQLWGANSGDINQQQNVRVVGMPKWYFHIEEYWRRIYIQDWDYKQNSNKIGFLGKKGIKYDASLKQHTRGIYRETKDNYFFYTDLCRTLPVEYWKNSEKTVRDHYLRLNNGNPQYLAFYNKLKSKDWKVNVNTINKSTWDFKNDYPTLKDPTVYPKYDPMNNLVDYTDFYTHFDQFTIPRGGVVSSVANYFGKRINPQTGKPPIEEYHQAYGDQSGARISAYPDRYYIFPTIQYQKVIHKNWQRLDGWQQRDAEDEQTGEVFGDGYSQTINIPFRKNDKVQSPFSDDNGKVYPSGIYMHNVVPDEQKIQYNVARDANGQPIMNNYQTEFIYNKARTTWHNLMPQQLTYYDGVSPFYATCNYPDLYKKNQDGMWVQQCLGAIVKAKVKVIVQDYLGGRTQYWTQDNNFYIDNQYTGKDQ